MKNAKKKNGAAAKGKGRATLSAQQTIPYLSMHPDGVCKLPGGLYTKTVEYEDINYSVASTEDQTAIFSGWSSFLNYFDSSLPFQLSFINRRSHSRSRYQVNIPKADDNYNSVRDEFTGMLKNQIAKSNNGIERSKYRAAKDTMNTILNGAKLPKIEALKKSRRELAGQKKALYAEYREAQRQMREAVAIKANIDHLLGITDERENKAQER